MSKNDDHQDSLKGTESRRIRIHTEEQFSDLIVIFLLLHSPTQANGTGGGGHVQLIQSAMKSLTFRTLCFPDNMKARGLDKKGEVPTYFYRDDGYRVWEATKR